MIKKNIVIAPDSFKGSIDALSAATAIESGWRRIRAADEIHVLPMADGGEGTLDALACSDAHARWQEVGAVRGPDGRPVTGRWLLLGNGSPVVELAQVSGLPLMGEPDPLGASTHGLGEVLRAVGERPRPPGASGREPEILVGLGGSASTDGGTGLLTALGAGFLDASGRPLPPGGGALRHLARIDLSELTRPGPLVVLSDVAAPLLGPSGAAHVFGPQKGADASAISILEQGLARLADLVGVDPDQPGMGAAGGTAYALVAGRGARLEPGAPFLARATGVADSIRNADVLITGEGRFDASSGTGKAVGHLLGLPGPRHRIVIAGGIETAPEDCRAYSLCELAGSTDRAMTAPAMAAERAATGRERPPGGAQ